MNKKPLLTVIGGNRKIVAFSFVANISSPSTLTINRITPTSGIKIYWGDGAVTNVAAGNSGAVAHAYTGTGSFIVEVGGSVDNITLLDLRDTKAVVAAGTIGTIKGLQTLYLSGTNSITTAAGEIGGLSNLTYLYIGSCGNVLMSAGEVGVLTGLTTLYVISSPKITINTGEIGNLVNLTTLHVQAATLVAAQANDFKTLTKIGTLTYYNSLNEAQVDAVVAAIYDARAAYLTQSKTLNIATSNAAPSGTYQAQVPPSSGKEYIYELKNDSASQGFSKWAAINYTA